MMNQEKATYNLKGAVIALIAVELIFWLGFLGVWFIVRNLMPSLKIENSDWLWALACLPVLGMLFIIILSRKNKKLHRFAENQLLHYLVPELSTMRSTVKFILFRLALAFLFIGLANPKIGTREIEAKQEGTDIVIALDVSNSMNAEDFKPNRLERAKRAISQLVDKLHGHRLGLIVFAGEAYVQLPITTDYSAAKMFLNTVDNSVVPVQGTAIGAAIELSMESFDFENPTQKTIIVISDGESHEDDPIKAAKAANEKGVIIHTIGMGSDKGAPIPEYRGKQKIGYKKDREGTTVITKLDERTLKNVANEGNGIYIRATNASVGLKTLLDEIESMDKTEFETTTYADYEDRFQLFMIIAFILLLIESALPDTKSRIARKLTWKSKEE